MYYRKMRLTPCWLRFLLVKWMRKNLKKEETQKKIRSYDFKRAVRFSKDHIRSLTRIHENFARYLTTYFSAQLRTFVQINVVQVEQLPYDEFIRSIPKMTILNIFEAEPLKVRMVLEVHPNVAYAMLDRLLGGIGTAPSKINRLTEIETIIMERIFSRAFESLQEAWKTVIGYFSTDGSTGDESAIYADCISE